MLDKYTQCVYNNKCKEEVERSSQRKKPLDAATPNGSQRGGHRMYTDYGYEVDGVEYATLDEAVHRDD